LLLSKASDIEVKTVSIRNIGKDGCKVDVLCNSFFQLIIGMQLYASSESQESNSKELLSLLLNSSHPYSSPFALIIAFDQGYGKMSVRKVFWKYNLKLLWSVKQQDLVIPYTLHSLTSKAKLHAANVKDIIEELDKN
jgi:hypothetical protein